ncbi:Cytochrome P450 76C1 [Striga hermonthica]|uniref:Cytochrome P450 76C1 n=1 Tax=Striga hermonthica TaxID=68872 RepID=A0A9N7RE47_STRHE|nr:Cytochrome P450 76C1 [Striga hermonthica]
MGRDPEFWERPKELRPERFLESEMDVRARDPMFIPFGIGRRGCPGMVMGLVATELSLANLLYAFDWELPTRMKEDDEDFDVLPGMTTDKKKPI